MPLRVPVTWRDPAEHRRKLADAINAISDGRDRTGSFTCDANEEGTVVSDTRVGTNSVITFTPTTTNAATEIGNGTIYIPTAGITDGQFTVIHASAASTDRTYKYVVTG